MPRAPGTSFALGALFAVAGVVGFAACDTGDGKTLRPATEPRPTTTTSSTVAPATPLETAAAATTAVTTAVAPAPFGVLAPWSDGSAIDVSYTCDGADASPPLSWTGVPDGTVELAVVFVDVDATGAQGRPFVHWLVTGIDPSVSSFAAGSVPPGATVRPSSFGEASYGGPCPPAGKPHRYFFRLHALDASLNLPPGVSRAELEQAMVGHVLAVGTLMGTYERRRR
jgi:Raf kinase inhibitor-like YbhB/YbcL family protein